MFQNDTEFNLEYFWTHYIAVRTFQSHMNPFTSLFYLAAIEQLCSNYLAAIQQLLSSYLALIQQLFRSYLEGILSAI